MYTKTVPRLQNDKFVLRLVRDDDLNDLLRIYSDEKSVPLFNGDNCYGDDFHYEKHLDAALDRYSRRYITLGG